MNVIIYKFSAVVFPELIFFYVFNSPQKMGHVYFVLFKGNSKIVNPGKENDSFHLCIT